MFELVCSTQFFLIPILYAYYNRIVLLAFLFTNMYVVSTVLYHANNYSNKHLRYLDLTTARTGGILTFVVHYQCTNDKLLPVFIAHNLIAMYLLACILDYYKNHLYVYVHMYFHFITSISMLIVACEYTLSSQHDS